jgi:hypothetical protein
MLIQLALRILSVLFCFIWKLFGIIQDHQFHFEYFDFLKGTQCFEEMF